MRHPTKTEDVRLLLGHKCHRLGDLSFHGGSGRESGLAWLGALRGAGLTQQATALLPSRSSRMSSAKFLMAAGPRAPFPVDRQPGLLPAPRGHLECPLPGVLPIFTGSQGHALQSDPARRWDRAFQKGTGLS